MKDAHMIDGAGYGRQLVLDGLKLDGLPDGSSSNTHCALFWIYNRIVEIAREIDDEPIFDGGSAGSVMPTAANRKLQMILSRILQGKSNVLRVFYESHDSSIPLDIGCPPSYCLVVVRPNLGVCVRWRPRDDVSLEGLLQDVHGGQDKLFGAIEADSFIHPPSQPKDPIRGLDRTCP